MPWWSSTSSVALASAWHASFAIFVLARVLLGLQYQPNELFSDAA